MPRQGMPIALTRPVHAFLLPVYADAVLVAHAELAHVFGRGWWWLAALTPAVYVLRPAMIVGPRHRMPVYFGAVAVCAATWTGWVAVYGLSWDAWWWLAGGSALLSLGWWVFLLPFTRERTS